MGLKNVFAPAANAGKEIYERGRDAYQRLVDETPKDPGAGIAITATGIVLGGGVLLGLAATAPYVAITGCALCGLFGAAVGNLFIQAPSQKPAVAKAPNAESSKRAGKKPATKAPT